MFHECQTRHVDRLDVVRLSNDCAAVADALAGDDRADNGPEDLFLEELVRNMKWATANRDRQRYQHREQRPAVDDVFELLHDADALDEDGDDEERLAFNNVFNAEPSRNIEQSSSPHKSFALRPGDPGFYSDRQQPAVAELDPVIAPGEYLRRNSITRVAQRECF